jgi:fatty acid desaturase
VVGRGVEARGPVSAAQEDPPMPAIPPLRSIFRDKRDFQSFHRGQDASFRVLAGLYGTIVLALAAVGAVAALPLSLRLPVWAAAFLVVGWAQYSIGNGLHEAVHRNLRNRRGDGWASLLTAYPIGFTMKYRDVHFAHHRHLGTTQDPDFFAYDTFPQSRSAMLARFGWFVSGAPALLQFVQMQRAAAGSVAGRRGLEPLRFIAVQFVILAGFWWAFGNPLYYVGFWALPIATVGKLLSTTRLLCEHASPRGWVVRSIDGPRWQTWVLGAFDFNYHAEHHLFPTVPYANLARLHRRNVEHWTRHPDDRPFDGRVEFFSGGYLKLLATWFSALPWRERPALDAAA